MTTRQQWIALIGLAIVLIALILSTKSRGEDVATLPEEAQTASTTEANATSTEITPSEKVEEVKQVVIPTETGNIVLDGDADVEVIEVEDYPRPVPNLPKEITIPDEYPANTKQELQQGYLSLVESLNDNPAQFEVWIEVANTLSTFGLYTESENALLYANKLAPKNSIAYRNLGYLYGFYIKDHNRAETAYRTAIANDPDDGSLYFTLFEFYKDVQLNSDKAIAVLEEGVEKNPTDANLQAILDAYVQ